MPTDVRTTASAAFRRLAIARTALRGLYRAPEAEVLRSLAPAATLGVDEAHSVRRRAGALIGELRRASRQGLIGRFMREYGLGTDEGLALLALAEAYLRVPDSGTASRLIHDKIAAGDWRAHAGASPSWRVNAATLGLLITHALLSEADEGAALTRLAARLGEPALRGAVAAAVRQLAEQFVLGRDIAEGLRRAKRGPDAAFRHSFDMLGEAARTQADADRYFQSYLDAIAAVGGESPATADIWARDTISVKLSALHCRYEPLQAARAVPELSRRVADLARAAKAADVGLTIDAEEAERLEMSLDIIARVTVDPSLRGWDGLGAAVQAYQRRASAVVAWADALGAASGRRIAVRLVKGAYWDAEIKRAQEQGLAQYPVFTRKCGTDVSYLACARAMLAAGHIYPAFATHNALTVATVLHWAGDRRDFEFQRLYGMGDGLYEALIARDGVAARTYAPIGGYRDLLAYLVRRLLENGANSSFVNQLADESLDEDALLADPVARAAATGFAGNPKIPAPPDLFGSERRNSAGFDLSDAPAVGELTAAMAEVWRAPPRLPGGKSGPRAARQTLAAAARAQPDWAQTPLEDRARCLERAADLFERDRALLMAILTSEGGKTLPDAVAEVREAVDYCRYYAGQARKAFQPLALPGPTGEANELRLAPRGVFVCISPWNFPLAIFIGQVAAALVAGNAVVAKPAPQTPLIADLAVKRLIEAGVPAGAVQLVLGGADVGQALTADVRTAGVAFTGSTRTAKAIARALIADDDRPIVPLIAETGGVNAMIVNSTALPEQVVADVITSAFRSAGQRCSALRLLCLQQDVAEPILAMLAGALAALRIGDPRDPSTDVGPVIDRAAKAKLMGYLAAHRRRIIASLPVPPAADGLFVPPTILRIDRIEDLREEVFGPVLHVALWRAGQLDRVIEAINASSYGLTLGLQSRIGAVAERVRATARVGNLYVNRSMIGAVVGVQPFGGEGLSGTGPKAGGPNYLPRFAVERTVSTDTSASGGNASLLALED